MINDFLYNNLTVSGDLTAKSLSIDTIFLSGYDLNKKTDDVYTTVNENSSVNWGYQGTDLKSLSSNWENSYTTLGTFSAFWSGGEDFLQALQWNENEDLLGITEGNTISLSSIYDRSKSYSNLNFLPLSGGTINGSISTINGNSDNWDSVYSSVLNTSSNWDSVYSSVNPASSNWDSVYSSVNPASSNWDSVYSSVNPASSNWDSVYSSVNPASSNWDSVYSSVLNTSSNWDSVYSSVNPASSNWDSVYSSVNPASSNWDSVYSSVLNTSSNWDSVYSSVNPASSNWDSVYSNVNSNSSTYATVSFTETKFLPLSGGIVTDNARFNKNVTIYGDLSCSGIQTFFNTVFSTTSALSVVHVGSGPAMWVGNNGIGDIASFYDIDQNIEILHVGGNNGSFPNVGIKTSSPNKDLTVNGELSASNTIWDANGNSNQWNSTYSDQTKYLPLSGGTMTGKLNLPASTTGSAPINIPHGNDPTSPSNGDLWLTGTLRYRDQVGTTRFVADTNRPNSFTQRQTIYADAFTTLPALRITQEGTGEALRVEDDPTPDSTAFIVGSGGNVGIGLSSLIGINQKLTVVGDISATGSLYGDGSNLTGILAGDTVATTLVRNNSANWDSVYTTVVSNSAAYLSSVDLSFLSVSGNWNSVYSNVNSNSASYATISFSNTKFLPLSGGTVTGDLTINGNLSALGTTTQIDTQVYVTSAVSVTNSGTGPALTVKQTGAQDIATFFDDSNTALIIKDGGNVGIGTTAPNEKLTVSGNISASGSYYGNGSLNIKSTTGYANIEVGGLSGAYIDLKSPETDDIDLRIGTSGTGGYISTQNSTNLYLVPAGNVGIGTFSSNEKLTVSGNISASGKIYGDGSLLTGIIDTGVRGLTGNYSSVYTTVNSNSATTWNYQGTDIKALTGNYSSVYTTVNSNSATWRLEDFIVSCSDESTNLTTTTSAVTFRVPFGMYLNSVRASVNVAPIGSTIVVDVKQSGSSIFSTKLSIDANEETSTTAATPAVISNPNLTDDSKVVVSIDQVGSATSGKGLKLTFKGYRV